MKKLMMLVALVVNFATVAMAAEELTLVAPPRGTAEEEDAKYKPIVDYLSAATGAKIKFVRTGNWLVYRRAVRDGTYDFYYGGPHFISYLVAYHKFRPVVRLAEPFTFIVAVTKDDTRFKKVSDLAGRQNCLHPEPNLGTLLFLNEFTNPSRQPFSITISGWREAWDGMVSGKCVATVLPRNTFDKFNKDGEARVLHTFRTVPNQAIAINPRISEQLTQKVRDALLAEDGCQKTCSNLLAEYASKKFVATDAAEYVGYSDVLRGDFLLQGTEKK